MSQKILRHDPPKKSYHYYYPIYFILPKIHYYAILCITFSLTYFYYPLPREREKILFKSNQEWRFFVCKTLAAFSKRRKGNKKALFLP